MTNEPLVSIITPMYNAEKYIEETIQSVLNQTYQNWEMIIVDNFSIDNSKDIVRRVSDPRIKLIELEYNSGGPARPRNIAIQNSVADYFAFLDADDLWKSEKLKISIENLINDNVDFVYTNYTTIGFEDKEIDSFQVKNIFYFLLKNPIGCSTVCCKNFYKRNKTFLFNEDEDYIAFEDYYLWLLLYKNGFVFKLLKSHLTKYRIHDTNLLGTNKQKIIEKKIKALDSFRNLFSNIYVTIYIETLKTIYKIKYILKK